MLITIALVSCEPDKVLYEVIPQKAKIIKSSFEKEAVFLKWDVSSVTNMFGMFADAKAFNQPLDNWDVQM